MTNDELLHRADEFEELGRCFLDHARILRNPASKGEPKRIFWPDTARNLVVFAEALLASREHKLRYLDENLVAEPGWNMMLLLFQALWSGHKVTVDRVCQSSGTFQPTARRWLTLLIDQGLVEICHDRPDDGLQPIQLTELGELRVAKILTGMQNELLQHGWSPVAKNRSGGSRLV